jgi:hypothetical protein
MLTSFPDREPSPLRIGMKETESRLNGMREPIDGATRPAASLYAFIRATLASHGGVCSRQELLASIEADPEMANRLARSQGFPRVLQNMKHSGYVELDGQLVRRTVRRVGRRRL